MTDYRLAARVTAVYLLTGFSWILFSDWLSFASADIETAHWLQTSKGLLYVMLTAFVLFWLIRRGTRMLSESEALFRLLIEEAPDAVFVQTLGRVAYANSAAARLLGAATPNELIGRTVMDIIDPASRETVKRRIAQVAECKLPILTQEERFLRLDGTSVLCEVSAVPVRYAGREGTVVFVRDVTARVEAQERLLYTQKIETIRQLAGGLAHDFNNLLQVINGYTELACEVLPGENRECRGYLEQVCVSGEQASALVGQLLTFSSSQPPNVAFLLPSASNTRTMRVLRQVTGNEMPQSGETCETCEAQAAGAQVAEPANGSEGAVVLIAEDEESVRKLAARVLRRAGYTVLEASDGVEAVALFEKHAGEIAAVVLDVVMPKMGGFEAYDRIHALDARKPILFASGFSGFDSMSHVALIPGGNLLEKPYEGRVLVAALRRMIGVSQVKNAPPDPCSAA